MFFSFFFFASSQVIISKKKNYITVLYRPPSSLCFFLPICGTFFVVPLTFVSKNSPPFNNISPSHSIWIHSVICYKKFLLIFVFFTNTVFKNSNKQIATRKILEIQEKKKIYDLWNTIREIKEQKKFFFPYLLTFSMGVGKGGGWGKGEGGRKKEYNFFLFSLYFLFFFNFSPLFFDHLFCP